MKLNVAAEAKLPGKTGKYVADIEYGDIDYLGDVIYFAMPLHIEAKYSSDGDGFNVAGILDTVILSNCSRCGREFDAPLHVEFDERFEKDGGGDDDDSYPYSGDEIDLSQMVSDSILLNYSPYGVCSEDCKGLCPVCGCDLNYSQCDCVREEEKKENPMHALFALLNDDKEV